MSKQNQHIFLIDRAYKSQAVDILCAGFRDYPVMHFFFGNEGDRFESCLRRLFEISIEARLQMEWPILGCSIDGQLRGVAYGSAYDAEDWPADIEAEYGKLFASLPETSQQNMSAYGQHTKEKKYPEPHLYLHAIAVLPEAQGKGVGKALLDGYQQLSIEHPTSTGVALNTELESNVKLYEHCGYSLLYHDTIKELKTWALFRPN